MKPELKDESNMTETNNNRTDEIGAALVDLIARGASLKEVMAVSAETMESMYAYAYRFYHQGKLDEAEKFFEFLCMYDLHNADYFLGLGAVYQLKKNYKKASDFYALSFALATNDYRAVFYTGQCQVVLENIPRAIKCFELVKEKSKCESIIMRSKVYLDRLEKLLNEEPEEKRAHMSSLATEEEREPFDLTPEDRITNSGSNNET